MKKEKLNQGDLFYLQLEESDKFIFGQILFDVEKQYFTPSIEQDEESYFDVYEECQLIRMYKGIYDKPDLPEHLETLIDGVFIYRIDSKANRLKWGKAGHLKIDYQSVEFPEIIGDAYGSIQLLRGELHIKTQYKDINDFEISWSAEYPEVLANECVHLQGREDLVSGEHYSDSFKEMDLRNFPELRDKVYRDLNLDPNISYYELSKEMGFDLARFYEH
ncbi:uncharacterized protein CHSO_2439 [Chryseobacterium sp. StRB126]|uniref:hypothetical protein n=1 Tax=Chryseobacterium sp. StRB126 TaxID=878220 RepID=UPI0004E98B67|nr:hypothetical protein [Chryseobacterium sp. StRB126]BAP31476.1 uncharacterized protein CHSO_2439 [Chryseobacterium sp. StRB126]